MVNTNLSVYKSRGATRLVVLLAFVLVPTLTSAQVQAVISHVNGTVEIQNAGGSWRAAEVGMQISTGTRISTGFGSDAVIDIDENTLRVRPLTRLSLDELLEREGVVSTEVTLEVGRVRGEVTRREDRRQEFTLRSPVATASVRGTSFEFDGVNLNVDVGSVEIANRFGQAVLVAAGEEGGVDGDLPPENPTARRRRESQVSTSTTQIATEESEAPVLTPTGTVETTGRITVTVEW